MPKAAINETCLYYEEHGKGLPLVMIQGYMGDHSAWSAQVQAFRKYFRVITFDARGLGKSVLSRVPFTILLQMNDVVGLMDFLKIDRAHILGVSLGGLVAQTIAVNHPERVMKLVLAATFPGTDPQYMGEEIKGLVSNPANANIHHVLNVFSPLAFNNPVMRCIVKLISLTPRASRLAPYVKQTQSIGIYSILESLDRIQSPTLVIAGNRDRVILPHSSEIIARKIPGARLVIVKDGSHAFFMEKRHEFNREVLRFLQGNEL